jgi:hypothetical protein
MKKFLKLCLFVLILNSCSSQIILTGKKTASNKPQYDKSQAFFILGVAQSKEIDGEAICKDKGINKIRTVQTALDVVFKVITVGIYTPRTMEIYCN